MAAVRDLSTSDAVAKSVINNTLKDFPRVEFLCEEQKDCIKNMVNGKDLFSSLQSSSRTGFGKSLNLSTLSTSNVFDE